MDFSEFYDAKYEGDGSFAVGSPASKELIERIISEKDSEAFLELYEHRKVWCGGYPLIHGRSTYGVFIDLSLLSEIKKMLLPLVIKKAINEPIEYFHYALFTLKLMIPTDQISPRPIGFGEQLMFLRERVRKYSFIPNLTGTWDTLATGARCLKPIEPDRSYEISAYKMGVSHEEYLNFFPCPLPNLDDETICPLSPEEIIKVSRYVIADRAACRLEMSALINNSKWWVFSHPIEVCNRKEICYTLIRESNDKQVETEYVTYKPPTPILDHLLHEKILRSEFSVRK